jgi:hypothetical protein
MALGHFGLCHPMVSHSQADLQVPPTSASRRRGVAASRPSRWHIVGPDHAGEGDFGMDAWKEDGCEVGESEGSAMAVAGDREDNSGSMATTKPITPRRPLA